jgi:hypothetical protein
LHQCQKLGVGKEAKYKPKKIFVRNKINISKQTWFEPPAI